MSHSLSFFAPPPPSKQESKYRARDRLGGGYFFVSECLVTLHSGGCLCAILLLLISRQTKVRLYLEYKRLFGRLAGIETEKNSFLPSLSPTYIVHWRTAAAQTSGFFPTPRGSGITKRFCNCSLLILADRGLANSFVLLPADPLLRSRCESKYDFSLDSP